MGWGQAQLAANAKTPDGSALAASTVAMIERGERGGTPAVIKAMADALGCTVADLIDAPAEAAS